MSEQTSVWLKLEHFTSAEEDNGRARAQRQPLRRTSFLRNEMVVRATAIGDCV